MMDVRHFISTVLASFVLLLLMLNTFASVSTSVTTPSSGEIYYPSFSHLTIKGRFWYDSQNRPVFLRGVCYPFHGGGNFWDQYDTHEMEGNLTKMRENNFNLVVLQVPMASLMYAGENSYSGSYWNKLTEFLQLCKDKGVYAALRTPDYASYTGAGWVGERWKNSDWAFNQTFLRQQYWFMANLTKRICDNGLIDAIAFLDVWSEAEANQYTKHNFVGIYDSGLTSTAIEMANASWHQWLRNRYVTLDALRNTWSLGRDGGSLEPAETDFLKIRLPTLTETGRRYNSRRCDYVKFMTEAWYNVTKVRIDGAKRYYNFPCGGSVSAFVYYTHQGSGGSDKTADFISVEYIADLTDVIMADTYGPEFGDFASLGTYNRRFNKPICGMEYGIKTSATLSEQKTFWVTAYGEMLAQGITASCIWAWQDERDPSSNSYGYGLNDKDGNSKLILSFMRELNQRLIRFEPYMDRALYDPKLAVIFSGTSHTVGYIYNMFGYFGILPVELQRISIYPYAVYEGSSRTEWDRIIWKTDDLTTLNKYDIILYDYEGFFNCNATWWQTLMSSTAKIIAEGWPASEGGSTGSDEYGAYLQRDLSRFPFVGAYEYASVFQGSGLHSTGEFQWGPYKGESFTWWSGSDGSKFITKLTLAPGAQLIGNLTGTGASSGTKWIVANNDIYCLIGPQNPTLSRIWSPFDNFQAYYEQEDYKTIKTGFAWFGYSPHFSITGGQIIAQVFDSQEGAEALLSNEFSTAKSATFYLSNLTDYGMSPSASYELTWQHNGTLLGTYSGAQLQNGVDVILGPQTMAHLSITEAPSVQAHRTGTPGILYYSTRFSTTYLASIVPMGSQEKKVRVFL